MDLKEIQKHGQSLWLDYIRRHLLTSGEFARLVGEDGIRGVTSNPSIFEKAIAGSTDYASAIESYERDHDQSAVTIYESLAVEDLRQAADILRPVYDATERRDGYVSMEVSPYLAHDTRATVDEARRLWGSLDRENVMIKVPATPEGIPAIRQLVGEGINVNVNVTLLFSRAVCRQVLGAYMDGLEALAQRGGALGRIGSVASMFVSRIDVLVDPMLAARLASAAGADRAVLRGLVGKIALANAKLAYQDWKEACRGPRWRALAERGARPQRLLWASTSTKDRRLPDLLYVEALIGPDTVDTIPPATLDLMRDHGTGRNSLETDVEEARHTLSLLDQVGISIDDVTSRLVDEGVQQFSSAFDKLMASIEHKRQRGLKSTRERLAHRLPRELADKVIATLADWRAGGKVRRLWARDASLWTGHDEGQWLDWLNIADDEQKVEPELLAFAAEARHAFTHAVVLGMGGSSLCPDVLAATLGPIEGYPTLLILDSTDPAQITALETRISLDKTLFIVSSKSGTTLEPNILAAHFYDRVREAVGDAHAGEHFVAVTDPGSPLQALAESLKFSRVFLGAPGIGGRYSALSDFGMLPAAVMGVDVPAFLGRVQYMVHACAPCVPPEANPGVLLGASAQSGRNKITLIASPKMVQAGAWIEQLLAESTGKEGRGLVPVDREPLGPPAVYDSDRLFVYLRLDEAPDVAQDDAVNALEKAGHPVVRIAVADPYDLGQEFFRSEIATAVAGAILGIDPFNQPDVEASKIAARTLTDAYESTGALPDERSFHREGSLQLFADERNHVALERATHSDKTLVGYLKAHLSRTQSGDYFAILAFIERNDVHERRLQKLRSAILGSRRVATCLGFGPRFLHSTGQAYKGGPNTGVFLQLTCDDPQDVKVPNRRVTFGIAKAAQARGDFQVLAERNRRALRVHLGRHVDASLETLCEAIERTVA